MVNKLPDNRYSVTQEYMGHPDGKRWIARFIFLYIGNAASKEDAIAMCVAYQAKREQDWTKV